jgi:hypothetical protein
VDKDNGDRDNSNSNGKKPRVATGAFKHPQQKVVNDPFDRMRMRISRQDEENQQDEADM